MSQYQAFRRAMVPQQVAQKFETTTFPAPTRGLIQDENEAFMQPGGASVMDNWIPTLRGCMLRGGTLRWCALPETTPIISGFSYDSGANHAMFVGNATKLYDVTTTSPVLVKSGQSSGNYSSAQFANQGGDWLVAVNDGGDYPLRFNGSTWTTLDGTAPAAWANATVYAVNARVMDAVDRSYWKCAVANTSAAAGTFSADRIAHPTFWVPDAAADGVSLITGPVGSNVVAGKNLVYVCKYRGRLFFIEANSMTAWYLPLNSVGGLLSMIPLSGSTTKGGKLLFCAVWSMDAGDGLDDKLVFCTDLGELVIFSGSDPSNINSWKQEGRYQMSPPMGMNAHIAVGGELLIATMDGIEPTSGAITKASADLQLSSVTRPIRLMWKNEANSKRQWAWSLFHWEEYGGIFVTLPGSSPGYCLVVNTSTGAWCRYKGNYDATCFMKLRADMFFGTTGGIVMQADRTGYDDGKPYVATLVGGWEIFQSPAQTLVWRQARATFQAGNGQVFVPQLTAVADYDLTSIPSPPPAGVDTLTQDMWDESSWGPDKGGPPPPVPSVSDRFSYAQWDQAAFDLTPVSNTRWVSIGVTGFSHAPVVQVTVGQRVKPSVQLIAINATFERCGVNV